MERFSSENLSVRRVKPGGADTETGTTSVVFLRQLMQINYLQLLYSKKWGYSYAYFLIDARGIYGAYLADYEREKLSGGDRTGTGSACSSTA